MPTTLFTQNTIACIWDFDKTLIPDYMQSPLFRRYGIDEATFWEETNKLAEHYRKRGYHLSPEIAYLNHLLTYVLAGPLKGLNNKILFECGADIKFSAGLPEFFGGAKMFARERPEYVKHDISVVHYIVSTGIAPMIRGIRGATTADDNDAAEIVSRTQELLRALLSANGAATEEIASAIFTVTDDLDAAFPAVAARYLEGWANVPLLCAREVPVPGSPERCIRVLLHWNTDQPASRIQHAYLHAL